VFQYSSGACADKARIEGVSGSIQNIELRTLFGQKIDRGRQTIFSDF
jgi:hypothetical protein